MELPIFKEWNSKAYPVNHDRIGRRLSRHISVTAQVISTPAGERQWSVRCNRCLNEFVLTDSQIDNPRTIICPCR
jgi:hypothetical protein